MISSLPQYKKTRHSIMGICARYQAAPKESHVEVVKRIFRYQVGTIDLCI